jgi:hypothetical protein
MCPRAATHRGLIDDKSGQIEGPGRLVEELQQPALNNTWKLQETQFQLRR